MRLGKVAYCLAAVVLLSASPRGTRAADPAGADVLSQARKLASNRQRSQALDLLARHVTEHPGDTDARVLTGIILSWEGRYGEARDALDQVLAGDPDYSDAVLALINVELWSDHAARAERLAAEARARRPGFEPYQKAYDQAVRTLERDRQQPAVENARVAEEGAAKWESSFDRSQIWFSDGRGSWSENQLSIKRVTPVGSVFFRVSRANRAGDSDHIFEIEAYPRIRPGTYAYLSAGWSPRAELYAHSRFAAEVHQSLPRGFEASLGLRHFVFRDRVNLITGSASKYYGNWLFTVRPYFNPDSRSRSFQLSARRYFGNKGNYWNFRYGTGASPVEIRSVNEIGILNSASFFQELNWRVHSSLTLRLAAGVASEDRVNRGALKQYALSGTFFYAF